MLLIFDGTKKTKIRIKASKNSYNLNTIPKIQYWMCRVSKLCTFSLKSGKILDFFAQNQCNFELADRKLSISFCVNFTSVEDVFKTRTQLQSFLLKPQLSNGCWSKFSSENLVQSFWIWAFFSMKCLLSSSYVLTMYQMLNLREKSLIFS